MEAQVFYRSTPVNIAKASDQEQTDTNIGFLPQPFAFTQLAQTYFLNSYHSRALNVKAALTCLLGYSFVTKDENKEPDAEYQKIEAFIESHQEYSGLPFTETLYQLCLDFELYGNGFLEVVRQGNGEIAEIYHLPSLNVQLKKSGKDIAAVQRVDIRDVTFTKFGNRRAKQNEYLHLKNYCPTSRFYGAPEWIGAIPRMSLDQSSNDYNIRKFENNAVPDTVITFFGDAPSATTEENIRKFFSSNFKGTNNSGKSLLLYSENGEAKVEVKPVGSEVKEASFSTLQNDVKQDIAAAHGVPPRLLGIMTSGQLGGSGEVREQMRMFRDTVIVPRQTKLEFLLNAYILPNLGVSKWKIKFDSFDIDDAINDAGFYEKIMGIRDTQGLSVLDANEIREELGYAPRTENPIPEKPTPTKLAEDLTKQLIDLRKQL